MKALTFSIVRAIPVDSIINCADNSGAKTLAVISVRGYKPAKRQKPCAGVGDIVTCVVKKGDPKRRHEKVLAVIIRQRKEYRRVNGLRVKFEDNAAVLVNDRTEPLGTTIKGPVAREAVERFSTIGKISSTVI